MARLFVVGVLLVILICAEAFNKKRKRPKGTDSGITGDGGLVAGGSNILINYDKKVKPKGITNVTFGVALNEILDIDEKRQIADLFIWIRLEWNEPRLQWNFNGSNGTKDQLVLPGSSLWLPDIALYQCQSEEKISQAMSSYNVRIFSDGRVRQSVPFHAKSLCPIHVQNFPYDQQYCRLKFGSWSLDGSELIMFQGLIDRHSVFVPSAEWDLIELTAEQNLIKYTCCEHPFSDVTLVLKIQRKSFYYIFNIAYPSLLLTSMAVLSIFMPIEAGEKSSVIITLLLALIVFLLILFDLLPSNSESVPVILIGLSVMMLVISICYISSIVILNFHFRKRTDVPGKWMKKIIFGILAKVTRVKIYGGWEHPKIRCYFDKHALRTSPDSQELLAASDPDETVCNMAQCYIYAYSLLDVTEQWQYVARILDRTITIVIGILFLCMIAGFVFSYS